MFSLTAEQRADNSRQIYWRATSVVLNTCEVKVCRSTTIRLHRTADTGPQTVKSCENRAAAHCGVCIFRAAVDGFAGQLMMMTEA